VDTGRPVRHAPAAIARQPPTGRGCRYHDLVL